MISWVRTGQLQNLGNFLDDSTKLSYSFQRDLKNLVVLNFWMPIKAKTNSFSHDGLDSDLLGSLDSEELLIFRKDKVYNLMNLIVSLEQPVLVSGTHNPF